MIFFFSGHDYFASLKAAIASATRCIDVEMYIFADDRIGREIADLLARKAYAGVKVRVLYDSVGSQGGGTQLFDLMAENEVVLQEFNPTFPFPTNLRRRNHRKVIIVDGSVGFLGGFNFMDVDWRDTAVRTQDPELLGELNRLFELAWEGKNFKLREMARRKLRRGGWKLGGVHVVPSYGVRHFTLIRQEYIASIYQARHRIWITNSYFVPDRGLLRALRRAARRGVDVRVLTAGLTDVRVARWAGQAVYSRLLRAGVRIFEYQPRVLHAKSMVVDETWFTVGTSNLDHLSLFHNLEVNLFGAESLSACLLAEQFGKDQADSKEILLADWKRRSRWVKLREKFFYAFRSWM